MAAADQQKHSKGETVDKKEFCPHTEPTYFPLHNHCHWQELGLPSLLLDSQATCAQTESVVRHLAQSVSDLATLSLIDDLDLSWDLLM